jgi:hypothetical protein
LKETLGQQRDGEPVDPRFPMALRRIGTCSDPGSAGRVLNAVLTLHATATFRGRKRNPAKSTEKKHRAKVQTATMGLNHTEHDKLTLDNSRVDASWELIPK